MLNDLEVRYAEKLQTLSSAQRLGLEVIESKSGGGHIHQEIALALLRALPEGGLTLPVLTLVARYGQTADFRPAEVSKGAGLHGGPEFDPQRTLDIVKDEFVYSTAFDPRSYGEEIMAPFVLAHLSARPDIAQMSVGESFGAPEHFWEEELCREEKTDKGDEAKRSVREAWKDIESSRIVVPVWESVESHKRCKYALESSVVLSLIQGSSDYKQKIVDLDMDRVVRVFSRAASGRISSQPSTASI